MADRKRDLSTTRHPVCGTRGMVATTEPLATAAGLEILAAIAANPTECSGVARIRGQMAA